MRIFLLVSVMLMVLVSGCAKHGFMMQTDKDYKGETSIGWGPMNIIDTSAAGAVKICIPSKEAVKDDPTNNWCRSWMASPPVARNPIPN